MPMKIHSPFDKEKAITSSSPASEITKQNVEEEETRLPPAPSEHEVEQIPAEPPTKPVLVIVSKHEFDAVLLQKKKIYSQTEVMVPTRGQRAYNCKMEICVYDLEVDNRMVDHILKSEKNPQVFVTWNFLGLEQSTLTMPLTQAHFHTNVVYSGPLSEEMSRHVNQSEMPIYMMLVKSDGSAERVGEGSLNLTPAIDQPDRGFLRCVNLSGSHGSASVYCSFKLHECCPGAEAATPPAETLEVGIGHLKLNDHEHTSPDANHLYVEYSLLGYCGPELETDSVPKSDVMRFNHTKRLKVSKSNAKHLEPMLKTKHAKTLRFIILAEPCSLTQETEIEEIGHADLNLMEEIVLKDQDLISTEIPVYDNRGQLLGSLSVTVIGNSTLQNYVKK
ncbi:uncharacterized protein LOC124355289 isoform X2 [Homalodisca vitripennis]|uniref:uncharacterized protein LOC124355289 isoform X2 n=1 Tax=Homalodisca vitripennis TaxID=197043 RepID=UPI001EECBDA0|nr:uncharacterized protein LOC124355289 isoform X2 [Homalodisca vitripennis]